MELSNLGALLFTSLFANLLGWKPPAKVLPGKSCGVNTPFRRYKSGEDASSPLECIFFKSRREREIFLEECFRNWHTSCKQRLPQTQLDDKEAWKSYANRYYKNESKWLPAHSHDNTDNSYLSAGKDSVLQLELVRPYHVFKIVLTLPGAHLKHTRTFIEGRVGMVDPQGLSLDQYIATNEICFEGDESKETPRTHECPQPIRGRFVSFRKTEYYSGWVFGITEVEIFVVNL